MDRGGGVRGPGAALTRTAVEEASAETCVVRESRPQDVGFAEAASALIDAVADESDIARRSPEWLRGKISARRAALAIMGGEGGDLVGFGYWA